MKIKENISVNIEKIINMNDKNRIALIDRTKTWTYTELAERVKRIIDILYDMKVQSGDRVMLKAECSSEFVAAYIAIHCIDAVCIPYSRNANDIIIERLQKLANARYNLFIFPNNEQIKISQYDVRTSFENDKESIADILFTSGTTGMEKGVVLNKTGVKQAIANISAALSLKSSDVVLLPMPLHHSHALGTLRAVLHQGATAILSAGISEIPFFLLTYSCTGISCSPVMVDWIMKTCKEKYEKLFKNLRFLEVGTAPLVGKNRKKVKEFFHGVTILISYGATEAPRAIYMDISEKDKEYSIGQPVGDYDVKIFSLNSSDVLAKGEKGRLGLKGKALMSYYLNDQDATKNSMEDGYFITGDIAYVDTEEEIVLVDRISDLLIIGGEKVYPSEIEYLINKIEGVEESVCIGIETSNHMLGHKMFVFIKRNENSIIDAKEIKEHIRKYVENYKIPSQVIFVDDFPRNEMGKIDKKRLAI